MTDPGTLVLASASPRRRRLLDLIGLPHRVVPASIEETPEPGESPAAFALRAARDKARDVAGGHPGPPVLAADTVVDLAGTILGKPASPEEAVAMLEALSGREHRVHTAMALAWQGTLHATVDTARVRFRPLERDRIDWYVATGEPMDKAGAYAIQGIGGLFVESIEGSPQTVVGLPIHRLDELFQKAGLDLWPRLQPPRGDTPRS